jgi:hypothetical protein
MKFLAAALVLFIGVTGDLALQSATSASAATPHAHHFVVKAKTIHADPFMVGH